MPTVTSETLICNRALGLNMISALTKYTKSRAVSSRCTMSRADAVEHRREAARPRRRR